MYNVHGNDAMTVHVPFRVSFCCNFITISYRFEDTSTNCWP